jgi:hypothetical protein
MLEAIVIIIALGGLEIALWWADHKRQAEQLATLEAIWVELALLNEEKVPAHPRLATEASPVRVDLPLTAPQTPTVIAQ